MHESGNARWSSSVGRVARKTLLAGHHGPRAPIDTAAGLPGPEADGTTRRPDPSVNAQGECGVTSLDNHGRIYEVRRDHVYRLPPDRRDQDRVVLQGHHHSRSSMAAPTRRAMHPITLCFPDPLLELSFRVEQFRTQVKPASRVAVTMIAGSTGILISFIAMDVFQHDISGTDVFEQRGGYLLLFCISAMLVRFLLVACLVGRNPSSEMISALGWLSVLNMALHGTGCISYARSRASQADDHTYGVDIPYIWALGLLTACRSITSRKLGFSIIQRLTLQSLVLVLIFTLPHLNARMQLLHQRLIWLSSLCLGEAVGYILERSARVRYLRTQHYKRRRDAEDNTTRREADEEARNEDELTELLAETSSAPALPPRSAHLPPVVLSRRATSPRASPRAAGASHLLCVEPRAERGGAAPPLCLKQGPADQGRAVRGGPAADRAAVGNGVRQLAMQTVGSVLSVQRMLDNKESDAARQQRLQDGTLSSEPPSPPTLCLMCHERTATHTLLPCMCTCVCEPCGKLGLFRYDAPMMMHQQIRPHCPSCHAPVDSMFEVDKTSRNLKVCVKLPMGARITIE